MQYSDIDSLVSKYNLTKYWDDVAKANYYYSESSGMFFTCDTEESVAEKGKYVKQKHLGGLNFMDDFFRCIQHNN